MAASLTLRGTDGTIVADVVQHDGNGGRQEHSAGAPQRVRCPLTAVQHSTFEGG